MMNEFAKKYYSFCLKADLKSGILCLKKTQETADKSLKLLQKKMFRRFIFGGERVRLKCNDPLVKSVILAYRSYYRTALLQPKKRRFFETVLNQELYNIAFLNGLTSKRSLSKATLEELLEKEFFARGWYSLFGTVAPLRSLLVWRNQKSKAYSVALPGKRQSVKVIFMSDFIELSWLHFATFGKYYVGGWAKTDSLYCVKQAYDTESDSFKTHYLVHEAQHLSDYKKFPKLKSADLEFRAKLAELALTKTPQKFLKKLQLEAKNDRMIPHSFAADRILKAVDTHSNAALKQRALELLKTHSKKLKSFGASKVTTAL